MKVQGASLKLRSLAGVIGIAGVLACGPRAEDINRIQPGYVRKAIFQTDSEWYYRRTIVDSETTNRYVVEGHGDIFLDRVKWRIEEKFLIAYKPYESVPGAQDEEFVGGDDHFEGTVLAAFPIDSHFDIQRQYDPQSGRERNILQENDFDRPWTDREYMRVNFSDNKVENQSFANRSFGYIPVQWFATGNYWTNLETRPSDPFASRFSDDYVEITQNVFLGSDIVTCLYFSGYSWAGFQNCGFGEAKMRHAFMRVKQPSDFVPRDYPDSYVRVGPDGDAITDPETGEVLREPIYDRFGFFRLSTPTYDRGYGVTESGRLFRAMIFNIWERHTDDAGNVIPIKDRTPKPIIYYTNTEFPARYRQVANEVGEEYDRVYTDMVRDATGRDPGFPMFELRENDCNRDNVVQFAQTRGLSEAVRRVVCIDGTDCSTDQKAYDLVGFGNLRRVCTSLEAATLDPTTGRSEFEWQRRGDPRYNMVVWLANPQMSGWGGYGPMHADGRTGETVSATSWLRGWSYEARAAQIADAVELINDKKSIDDIVFGQDVRRHVTQTLVRKNNIINTNAGRALSARIAKHFDEGQVTREKLIRQRSGTDEQLAKLRQLEGTELELQALSPLDFVLASNGAWREGDEVSDELREAASLVNQVTRRNMTSGLNHKLQMAMADAGFCFPEAEFDPHFYGLALLLKDKSRDEVYDFVVKRYVKHVMLHELGHNVGLSHNFEGTYDALNYADPFWDNNWSSDEEKLANRYDEFRHTTVMEYIGQGKGIFGDFLGKYDEAALRFGYANQVEVFEGPSVDPDLEGGFALRDWRYRHDYQELPDHLCGPGGCVSNEARRQVLSQRRWVDFDPQNPPKTEVPYLFCDNFYDRLTPFCSTFDYGSNLREIMANYYAYWSNHYFFTNFNRDRTFPWFNAGGALIAGSQIFSFMDTAGQYLYYLNATDPSFRETPLASDMAAAVGHGLNIAAEMMSTPRPGRHCAVSLEQDGRPVFLPAGFLQSNQCDEYLDINSDRARAQNQINVALGDGRPPGVGFTPDYEEFGFSYFGSYFDKSNSITSLGRTRPRFFRFNYDLDFRNYQLSIYRLFEREIRTFYSTISRFDGFYLYAGLGEQLGSFWCPDAANPDVVSLGSYEPRRLLDIDAEDDSGLSLPGPSEQCDTSENTPVVYPSFQPNLPFLALVFAHVSFSSDFDEQLDMGKAAKIYVVGADDDVPEWNDFPNCDGGEAAEGAKACYCSLVDDYTGWEYRSIRQTDESGLLQGQATLGCELIEAARTAQSRVTANGASIFARDLWREWIERLEFARSLYRNFHLR